MQMDSLGIKHFFLEDHLTPSNWLATGVKSYTPFINGIPHLRETYLVRCSSIWIDGLYHACMVNLVVIYYCFTSIIK